MTESYITKLFFLFISIIILIRQGSAFADNNNKHWVKNMREIHNKFTGKQGTFAHFGDSITVTMAFWSPLQYTRKNSSPEMEAAFEEVNEYMQEECWRDWKGPEYGNDGMMTIRWAYENIDKWLDKLNPETALIMFGTNDLYSLELDEYKTKMKTVIQRCLDNGTVVILNTIPPRNRFEEKSATFAEAVRDMAQDMNIPLVDYHAEIMKRRPDDWNGAMDKFSQWEGYNVPTLLARDGTHPSHPKEHQDDYSEEGLNNCGFSLRNYMVLMKYNKVIKSVLRPPVQDWFPKAPPLPEPRGEVIHVTNVNEFFKAVDQVKPGGTILLADGHYIMPRYIEINKDNITLRSESGNREKVIIDGLNSRHGELIGITRCSGVTIADLTIQNIMWNGFKINSDTNVQKVTIYNCVIHNIWQRGIKGVIVPEDDRENTRPKNCRIQNCLFYNDHKKRFSDDPKDTPENFKGDYIGGIDTMYATNWIISDNVFVGIQGRNRSARGAIFIWHDSRDCIIERNIIIDCDLGIALGNSHRGPGTDIHCTGFIVRNNFVTRALEGGILADYTKDCIIAHNTVHHPDNRLKRLIRLVHDNDGLLVANNLLSGPEIRNESSSDIVFKGNIERDVTEYFIDPENGNLHLKKQLPEHIGKTFSMTEVTEDIDRQKRTEKPCIGADEF
ncbi:hypothetical protein GF312_20515 [Candidatus Poribacteria bacterium]|nr:hypothetical protein [Candidatus Poribacteria bacterium]